MIEGRYRFIEGDLDRPDIQALIAEHVAGMAPHSPPESIHALMLDGLRAANIVFWSMRQGEDLLGMGALKKIDEGHAEIKSMRTVAARRGHGAGAALLRHIIAEARARGFTRLSLETGAGPFFAPARALYARAGFSECPPFEGYREDRYSVFMTLAL